MGWRLKPESDERALIAALRALVEAEASQDPGHTADRKRGGVFSTARHFVMAITSAREH